MAGSDNLTGVLVGVGAIVGAMGLLYLANWMARVSQNVREHEIEREQRLAALRMTSARPAVSETPTIRRAA